MYRSFTLILVFITILNSVNARSINALQNGNRVAAIFTYKYWPENDMFAARKDSDRLMRAASDTDSQEPAVEPNDYEDNIQFDLSKDNIQFDTNKGKKQPPGHPDPPPVESTTKSSLWPSWMPWPYAKQMSGKFKPHHVAPQHVVPQHVVPQHVVPQHVVPHHVAPQHAVSHHHKLHPRDEVEVIESMPLDEDTEYFVDE